MILETLQFIKLRCDSPCTIVMIFLKKKKYCDKSKNIPDAITDPIHIIPKAIRVWQL